MNECCASGAITGERVGLRIPTALASGWPRYVTALFAGGVGALAMPPFSLLATLSVSLIIAVWLLDGSAIGRYSRGAAAGAAALAGWFWGFGYFVSSLWWLGAAFLVEADQFAWALPLGVVGLPAVLAFFPALGFALAWALWSSGAGRLCALAVGLASSEWLRGHIFTGFPWNTLGLALGQNLWLMQGASLVGLYGLTVFAVMLGAAPATLGTGATLRERWTAPALALAGLAALAAFGGFRLPSGPAQTVADVRLRLMQPNLPQDAKFRPENRNIIMRRYLVLSDSANFAQSSGLTDTTHLIWPESAFPFLLHRDTKALAQIAALLPPGVTLITGAVRAEELLPGNRLRFFNAMQVIDDSGTILSTYDKVHLVPFGEYLPNLLDGLIRSLGLRQFVHIPGGFQAGRRGAPPHVSGLPRVAAAICYEAVFPGEVIPDGVRPGVILNLTNDAWFGNSPGPYQHFAQARLRAVEQGIPLVRAANTGISAVVDPYGRVVGSLPLGSEGILDALLPEALPATSYSRYGDLWFGLMLVLCGGVAALARWPLLWSRDSRAAETVQSRASHFKLSR